MKLLFYVEHFSLAGSGAENDAVNLCLALVARGHHVSVACRTGSEFPAINLYKSLGDAEELYKKVAPDLTVDWGMFCTADIHRLGGGIHQSFLKYNLEAYSGLGRLIKSIGYRKAKHKKEIAREKVLLANPKATFMAISQMVADQAIEGGALKANTPVVYNGVNTTRFNKEACSSYRQAIRRDWGLDDSDVAFLFVAHNLKLKNLQLMKLSFDSLYKANPQIKLVVCGKRKPGFKAPYLVYAGTTSEMERFYAGADALVHPTYFDSFANVVLEAMSCGLPALVSNCAGVSELVDGGKDGFVLSVTDADCQKNWQDAIVQLLDEIFRHEIGQKAVTKATQYDFTSFVDKFEEELQQVLIRKLDV